MEATPRAGGARRPQPGASSKHGQQPTRPRSAGVEAARDAAARLTLSPAAGPRRVMRRRQPPRRRWPRRPRHLEPAARWPPSDQARVAADHYPTSLLGLSHLTSCPSAAGRGSKSVHVDDAAPRPVGCKGWLGGDRSARRRRPPREDAERAGLNPAAGGADATTLADFEAGVLRPRASSRLAANGRAPARRDGDDGDGEDHAAARGEAEDRSSTPHAGCPETSCAPRRITTPPLSLDSAT
jgi:hypothetical protein